MVGATIALLAYLMVVAGVAHPDDGPAPPARFDDPTVLSWIKANLKTGGWTLISADDEAVTLGSPEGVEVLEKGILRATIRREYYGSVKLGDQDSRSNRQTWLVDCKSKTFGLTEMAIYRDNNLTGPGEKVSWTKIVLRPPTSGSQNARALKRICEAPKTGKPFE